MLSYNIIGTQRGQHVLCTRNVTDEPQPVTVVHRLRNIIDFSSNGEDISFTQTMEIINEQDEATMLACTLVDNTVWSPNGPIMRTQDRRLQFLRFSQRDSILFAAVVEDSRHFVEIQLASNKFVLQTSFEIPTCRPIAADACNKYIWVITDHGTIEVHNIADKEHRSVDVPEEYTAKSILILHENGRSAVAVLKHVKKHFAYVAYLALTDSKLNITDITQVGRPGMFMLPGTLVQRKKAIIFTIGNAEQQQQLVTLAANNNTLFCAMHNTNFTSVLKNEPFQRLVFTDVLVSNNDCIVGLVVNRNMYTMLTCDMTTSKVKIDKLQRFPDSMGDFIIDRVILMRQQQDKLEELPQATLISASLTDSITSRMRQQVEISTSTARAMADASRGGRASQSVNIKDLCLLREANELTKKQMMSDHQRAIKDLTASHNSRTLELEQRIVDLIASRDARVPAKQHEALKQNIEKLKLDLRKFEEAAQSSRASLLELQTQTDATITGLQQRVKVVLSERDTARAQLEASTESFKAKHQLLTQEHLSAVQKIIAEHKVLESAYRDQLAAEKITSARFKVERDAFEVKFVQLEKSTASEIMLLGAQLNDVIAKSRDNDSLQQLNMQIEALQQRGRIQFETLQREIDSLRKANSTLSQSYHTLTSITKFNFLPDGTSLETALEMIRHLSVFQHDLATAREENTTLRQKIKELELK